MLIHTKVWDRGVDGPPHEYDLDMDMTLPLPGRNLQGPDGLSEIISAVTFNGDLCLLVEGPNHV